MAMEEITARMGLDSSAFTRGVNQVENSIKRIGNSAKAAGDFVQRLFAGFIVTRAIKAAIDFGGAIGDMAEHTRTSVQGLQALQHDVDLGHGCNEGVEGLGIVGDAAGW